MNIKTITTVDGVNVVDFGSAASRFYWIENLGSTTVYVSGNENIVPDGDNVKVLSARCGTMVENLGGKVYILGAGKFQITNQGDKFPPFRNAPVADGGVMASGNLVQIDGLQEGVPFSEISVSGDDIIGQELTVNVCGKNLLKYPYAQTTRTLYGITFTDNGDGSITASGTHDGGTNLSYFGFSPWWASPNGGRLFLPKGNTVTFRVMGLPNTYQGMISVKKDNTSADAITAIYVTGESVANYTAKQDCYIACGIYGSNSSVGQAVNFTAYPQLELGDTATAYEPYHGSTTTITPDSNPYVIPNDIRQVEGLNNISVSEGEISVTGVRKNAAVKKIWDKIDELTTAIIVSNGETIE